MKKLSLSLMLNVSLALMLALSLIYPQSVAVNFVATWAILATVICVVAGGVGVYAAKWHLNRSQFGIRIDHDLASISDHSLASQSITIWHASDH